MIIDEINIMKAIDNFLNNLTIFKHFMRREQQIRSRNTFYLRPTLQSMLTLARSFF